MVPLESLCSWLDDGDDDGGDGASGLSREAKKTKRYSPGLIIALITDASCR